MRCLIISQRSSLRRLQTKAQAGAAWSRSSNPFRCALPIGRCVLRDRVAAWLSGGTPVAGHPTFLRITDFDFAMCACSSACAAPARISLSTGEAPKPSSTKRRIDLVRPGRSGCFCRFTSQAPVRSADASPLIRFGSSSCLDAQSLTACLVFPDNRNANIGVSPVGGRPFFFRITALDFLMVTVLH